MVCKKPLFRSGYNIENIGQRWYRTCHRSERGWVLPCCCTTGVPSSPCCILKLSRKRFPNVETTDKGLEFDGIHVFGEDGEWELNEVNKLIPGLVSNRLFLIGCGG